jgi:chemotaxis methyl-accepting protein methylase
MNFDEYFIIKLGTPMVFHPTSSSMPNPVTFRNLLEILGYVEQQRGIDFNTYRANTIKRRLALRLQTLSMPDCDSYLQFLKEDPGEIDILIDTFFINVTRFFRTPFIFEVLYNFILPELVDTCENDTLRIRRSYGQENTGRRRQ